jgi:hypothetical protein
MEALMRIEANLEEVKSLLLDDEGNAEEEAADS